LIKTIANNINQRIIQNRSGSDTRNKRMLKITLSCFWYGW